MAKNKYRSAAELLLMLSLMKDGEKAHSEDGPLPAGIRTRLDEAFAALESTLAATQAAKARHHEASQAQKEAMRRATEAAAAVRRSVYAMYSDKDKVVEDYGLLTRSKIRKKSEKKTDAA